MEENLQGSGKAKKHVSLLSSPPVKQPLRRQQRDVPSIPRSFFPPRKAVGRKKEQVFQRLFLPPWKSYRIDEALGVVKPFFFFSFF